MFILLITQPLLYLGCYFGTVMIGVTATILRSQQISSNGLWWLIAQKFPASEFNFFPLICTKLELENFLFSFCLVFK